MRFAQNATISITNSYFINNTATSSGGAINIKEYVQATLMNCTFQASNSTLGGAFFFSDNTSVSLESCTFHENNAAFIRWLHSGKQQLSGACY